ncbi:hypothetical protein J7M07_08300 [bacterium]|nr:hypothetical protein [bacterium]
MRIKNITLFLIIMFLPLSTSFAQIVYNQPYSSTFKIYYNTWSLENSLTGIRDDISQKTTSLSGFIPIRDNFEARYYIVTASNNLDLNNTENELSGLGDLRVQFSHSFYKDRLLISTGLNLPTGAQKLDTDHEIRVIEFLSRDYLSLPLRRYGEGFGFNLLAGGAAEIGQLKCGMTAAYRYTGTYEPYMNYGDYNPGNTFSLGANSSFAHNTINYTASLAYLVSGTDRLDDNNVYKQAPQFITGLSATYFEQPYRATLGTRMIIRSRNTRYSITDGIIESQLKKYGDEFDIFFQFVYTTLTDWRFTPHIAMRKILSSEEVMYKSSIYDFGLNISRKFSDHLILNVGSVYHRGSTDMEDISISGIQIATSLAFTY